MRREIAFKDMKAEEFLHVVYNPNTIQERQTVKVIASVYTPTYLDGTTQTIIRTVDQTTFVLDPEALSYNTPEMIIEPWSAEV